MRPSRRRLFVLLCATCLTVAVPLVGVRLASGERPAGVRSRVTRPEAPSDGPVIGPHTVFRYRTVYQGCGQERQGSGPAPVGLVGLGRTAVERAFPRARIVSFSPDEVVLVETRPGCVPGGITLVLRDGVVVAYYGRPGDLGGIYRVTRLRAADLAPRDRARLTAGVVYETAPEADRAIEALRSSRS